MIRLLVLITGLASALSFTAKTNSGAEAAGYVFEGRIMSGNGDAIAGVEVLIVDMEGKVRKRAFSGMDGRYQVPLLLAADEAQKLRMEVSHVYYQPAKFTDILAGAMIGAPSLKNLAPDQMAPVFASMRTVRHDFALTRSSGSTRFPAQGPLDYMFPESYFREALLLASQDRKAEAAEMMKVYAQIGRNPREVERSLQFLSEHYRQDR